MACPSCGSHDIDTQQRECRACKVGLPDGSFDVRPRYRTGRSSMRAANGQRARTWSDKRTESITGGAS